MGLVSGEILGGGRDAAKLGGMAASWRRQHQCIGVATALSVMAAWRKRNKHGSWRRCGSVTLWHA